jgi:enoyl-CoA hydratase/carnithine racemase
MADPVLLVDRADGVATLTLNRPQALNALSRELRRQLRDAFVELPRAGDVDVLILTGAGRAPLAADMRSAPQDVVRAYKRIIDAGFATTLADGLGIEAVANRAHARTVTPEAIAARRTAVQARGRDQSGR